MGTELPRSPLTTALAGVVRAECRRQGRSERNVRIAAGIAGSSWGYWFAPKATRDIPLSAIEAVAFELGLSVSALFHEAEERVDPLEVDRFIEQARNLRGISDADRAEILRAIRGEEVPNEKRDREGRAETGT